jgi:hypothetical protein
VNELFLDLHSWPSRRARANACASFTESSPEFFCNTAQQQRADGATV